MLLPLAEPALPIDAMGYVVGGLGVLITVAWLAYLYR
jgi:hypothetical protein